MGKESIIGCLFMSFLGHPHECLAARKQVRASYRPALHRLDCAASAVGGLAYCGSMMCMPDQAGLSCSGLKLLSGPPKAQ